MDCMLAMKEIPDKYFDLAIVDPPYFKGPNNRGYYGRRINKLNIKRRDYLNIESWDTHRPLCGRNRGFNYSAGAKQKG